MNPIENPVASDMYQRILGDELRSFVRSGSDEETRSVIIEVAGGIQVDPRRMLRRRSFGPRESALPTSLETTSARLRTNSGGIRTLRKALHALGLERAARWNSLAHAFVVEVTPMQLERLASLGQVQAIRPNSLRTRRTASA